MSIFNSLGSNYNFAFVIKSLLAGGNFNERTELSRLLQKRYGGSVFLTNKGRDALRIALRAIDKKGSVVGICGFTCYAVYKAVNDEEYGVEYLDIDEGLNFGIASLQKAFRKNSRLKVVVVQNTLGIPCDIEEIEKFCRDKKIILIEDLAHCVGAVYRDGREAGTVGDFVILSFGQDKMIDAVSGGALIVRNSGFKIREYFIQSLPLKQEIKDRFYPLLTWLVRKTYDFGVGKVLHETLKKLNLLSVPMGEFSENVVYRLPDAYCGLILDAFAALDSSLIHRQKIVDLYSKYIKKDFLIDLRLEKKMRFANLRFPILVKDRKGLINFLKGKGVYASDIWYDAVIAPGRFLQKTDYKKGMCMRAEKITSEILNLPTHRNVGEIEAKYIANSIGEWAVDRNN